MSMFSRSTSKEILSMSSISAACAWIFYVIVVQLGLPLAHARVLGYDASPSPSSSTSALTWSPHHSSSAINTSTLPLRPRSPEPQTQFTASQITSDTFFVPAIATCAIFFALVCICCYFLWKTRDEYRVVPHPPSMNANGIGTGIGYGNGHGYASSMGTVGGTGAGGRGHASSLIGAGKPMRGTRGMFGYPSTSQTNTTRRQLINLNDNAVGDANTNANNDSPTTDETHNTQGTTTTVNRRGSRIQKKQPLARVPSESQSQVRPQSQTQTRMPVYPTPNLMPQTMTTTNPSFGAQAQQTPVGNANFPGTYVMSSASSTQVGSVSDYGVAGVGAGQRYRDSDDSNGLRGADRKKGGIESSMLMRPETRGDGAAQNQSQNQVQQAPPPPGYEHSYPSPWSGSQQAPVPSSAYSHSQSNVQVMKGHQRQPSGSVSTYSQSHPQSYTYGGQTTQPTVIEYAYPKAGTGVEETQESRGRTYARGRDGRYR